MRTQTSLVAEHVRLQQWAEQIHACQNRPVGTNVENWCEENGITKANYYYRLRRVRKAFLDQAPNNTPGFVELPVPADICLVKPQALEKTTASGTVALLHGPNHYTIEILSTASADFIRALIGALSYVQ